MRSFRAANHFVQLQLNRGAVAILRILNQEDHQEGHNGGAGINDQLPGIAKAKERPVMAQSRMMANATPKATEVPSS